MCACHIVQCNCHRCAVCSAASAVGVAPSEPCSCRTYSCMVQDPNPTREVAAPVRGPPSPVPCHEPDDPPTGGGARRWVSRRASRRRVGVFSLFRSRGLKAVACAPRRRAADPVALAPVPPAHPHTPASARIYTSGSGRRASTGSAISSMSEAKGTGDPAQPLNHSPRLPQARCKSTGRGRSSAGRPPNPPPQPHHRP